MTLPRRLALAAFAGLALAPAAQAADIKPAVVYDLGGKFDRSFNESANTGAERFMKETGIKVAGFEPQNGIQVEQGLRNYARKGYSPIIGIGFSQAVPLEKVAKEFPHLQFAIIDMVVMQPNIRSVVFKEQEGSYLVGQLATLASKTGKLGFVGGMDVPLIHKFSCGYVQGAKATNAKVEVFVNMTGTTGAAWNDPVKGGELARSQIGRGADVVFQAAGATGIGVLQAVADGGKLGIGVDSNQNGLHPGQMLTTMLKRVDVAVYSAFMDARNDRWSAGIVALGLKEGGVAWALDKHNQALITPAMKAAVEKSTADIISGKVQVHDYQSDGKCPV